MSFSKNVLPALFALIIAPAILAADPPKTAQSTGTPESKRLTQLANQCAEEYTDLSGEISTRLYKFRNAGAELSNSGRSAVMSIGNKRNLSKDDCTDISAMLTSR